MSITGVLYISGMKIVLLCIGSTDIPHVSDAVDMYTARLKHYASFEMAVIPDKKAWKKLDPEARKTEEGRAILESIEGGDIAVLLDEKGKEYTSEGFASYLQKAMNSGRKRMVFIVGGAYGFSSDVYQFVPSRIAISKMTFSHQLIRTLFTEQLYRAMTILKNEPYHNR